MQNANAKKSRKSNPSIEEKKDEIKSLNLSSLKSQLDSLEIKEKKSKENLYIYPEGWNKEKINSDEGKKFRNRLRNQMKSICNNILFYAKSENQDALQKEIERFQHQYKSFYSRNDYSLSSLSASKDESKEKDLSLMMQIIKLSMQ